MQGKGLSRNHLRKATTDARLLIRAFYYTVVCRTQKAHRSRSDKGDSHIDSCRMSKHAMNWPEVEGAACEINSCRSAYRTFLHEWGRLSLREGVRARGPIVGSPLRSSKILSLGNFMLFFVYF
jgi:hypothetical protein